MFSRPQGQTTRAQAKTHHFGDRNTLAFSSRHSSYRRRADLGVLGVRDAEHAKEQLHHVLVEGLFGLTGEELAGDLELEREQERLSDGERCGVIVVLLVVDHFAAVAFAHLAGGDAAVRDVSVHGEVAEPVVGDRLEEGRAAV